MRIGFRKTGKRKTRNDKYVIVDNSVEIGDISRSKSRNTLKKQGKTGKICPPIELGTIVKPTWSIKKRKQKCAVRLRDVRQKCQKRREMERNFHSFYIAGNQAHRRRRRTIGPGEMECDRQGGICYNSRKSLAKSLLMRDKGSRKFIERHVIRENEERAGKNIRSERN